MIRRSQTRMSSENMKRVGSLESQQIPAKVPKIENDQNVRDNGGSLESPQISAKVPRIENDQLVNDTNEQNLDENSKINEIFMKKIDSIVNIAKKVERNKFSNQEIDNLNSKLTKVLNVLNENSAEPFPKFQMFNRKLGNVMTCYMESFLDMEDFMTNYGITGKNVTSTIFSYLDFKSMLAARMVSKTWYAFIENERGLWIDLMRKCFAKIKNKTRGSFPSDLTCLPKWQRFGDEIIEKNEKVADIVTLISTFRTNNPNKMNYSWADQYTNYFRSPIDTIKHLEQQKKANPWQNLNFVKILVKYGVLDEAMGREKFLNEGRLLCWSLLEMDALKFVVSILREKFQFKLCDYSHYSRHIGSSPMWDAMRHKENGLEKVQLLVPLTSKRFWNSRKKISFSEFDHTPLADAIMIGNVEIVKAIMPYTKVTANPKGQRFGSYLHVAVKYGQLAILKMLIFQGPITDWQKLTDKEGRSAYDLLKDENFQVEIYDHNKQYAVKTEGDEGKKCKQDMLEFIESIM